MVDSLRYKDWLDKSSRDTKSEKILKEHNCGNNMVAFHCQQSIEKFKRQYLKSIDKYALWNFEGTQTQLQGRIKWLNNIISKLEMEGGEC